MELTPEQFISSWPEDNTSKNEVQWAKGDMTLGYFDLMKSSNTSQSSIHILQSLAELVGESTGSIRSYAWVSKKFPPENRDRDLSWSHYRTAAWSKNPKDWIETAVTEGLTVRQLKARIVADEKTTIKHYRGPVTTCTTCNNPLLKKSRFKIYQDDKLIGDFCSYGCLAAYASNAAIEKKGDSSGFPDY